MDTDAELARFKWILFAGIAFLISAIYSVSELRYAVWGKTAEAQITRVFETRSSGRRSDPVLRFEYHFTEADGTNRSERDTVNINWPVPETGIVTVQYLAGVADSSRLQGNSRIFAVYVFLGCLGLLAIAIYRLIREANEPIQSSSRYRNK